MNEMVHDTMKWYMYPLEHGASSHYNLITCGSDEGDVIKLSIYICKPSSYTILQKGVASSSDTKF